MTDTAKRLGYGGSGEIDGVQVLITSGSFDAANLPSYLEMWSIPPTGSSRSRIKHADGVSSYSGSIGFDVTQQSMDLFGLSRLLERNFSFDAGIHDGENHYIMEDCKVQSITLSGAPAGLVTASVSFVATSGKSSGAVANAYLLDYSLTPGQQPAAYWWSGKDDVRDWTFVFNQDVTTVYSNEDTMAPRYLRTGLISYVLTVTTYAPLAYNSINVITSSFTLTGDTTAEGYTFNGPSDLGMFGHAFETAASAVGSDSVIIT